MGDLLTGMSERMIETFNFRVPDSWRKMASEIAQKERRELADVQRAIFERGIAAYKRDGLLFEPVSYEPQQEKKRRAS